VSTDLNSGGDVSRRLSKSLSDGWRKLCARYVPLEAVGSIWRYSRARTPLDPEQGWKLHVSATVLTANSILASVAPLLHSRGILFKCPASLHELNKLNCGLFYGYTQIGKCLTVYPPTTEEAVALAEMIHELTRGTAAPTVPFDLKFRPDGCVYYRYGAFTRQEIRNEDGTSTLALRHPKGTLVPDSRESGAGRPEWVSDPFSVPRPDDASRPAESPLKTTYRVFRALKQRGKGGVYQAVDLSVSPPRLCVLKEGRRHGEPGWDGRDGHWRVNNEKKNLRALRARGVDVPRVYASFETEGRVYLATEFIEGLSLQELLSARKRRLPVRRAIMYALDIARLLAQIHSAGWVWRDCKPSNLIVGKGGVLRPLDFEGACPSGEQSAASWGTPAFVPADSHGDFRRRPRAADDLYALGVVIYYLLSGRLPSGSAPLEKLRSNIPVAARQLVAELLDTQPQRRPASHLVSQRLAAIAGACDDVQETQARSGREIYSPCEVGEAGVGAQGVEDGVAR
jgi:hypothetical protein